MFVFLDSVQELEALNMTDEFINDLIVAPACYDTSVSHFVDALRSYNLSVSAVTVITEKIYEMVTSDVMKCLFLFVAKTLKSSCCFFFPLKKN